MTTTQTSASRSRALASQRCPVTNAIQPNRVRNFDGFHVSYNPHSADYGCDTTALVLQGRVFFVLNGDHAADLLDAAEQRGLQGCVDLFIARIDHANAISEHRMAVGAAPDPFGLQPTTLDMIGQRNVDRIVAALPRPQA